MPSAKRRLNALRRSESRSSRKRLVPDRRRRRGNKPSGRTRHAQGEKPERRRRHGSRPSRTQKRPERRGKRRNAKGWLSALRRSESRSSRKRLVPDRRRRRGNGPRAKPRISGVERKKGLRNLRRPPAKSRRLAGVSRSYSML